jgi:hypothetical protein
LISLIHPSRSRPHKSVVTTTKWLKNAGIDDIELIVSIDDSDPYRANYLDFYSHYDVFKTKVVSSPNKSAVDAINNGAKEAKGNILIVVSDDSDCPENWAKIILEAVADKKDWVLKVWDGVQKWIVTMPIMDRVYYERFGYIYYPEYRHMFVDTDFTHVADGLGKILWRNDITFNHLHYSVTKVSSDKDEVSRKADSTWNQGKNLYISRFMSNFGMPESFNKWDINSDGHRKWLHEALKMKV